MEAKTSTSPRPRKRPKRFTGEEIRFIEKLTIGALPGERKSARELAICPQMKRHTKESIATRIKNSGLADKKRSEAIKSGRRLSKEEKGTIISTLRGSGRYWPTSVASTRLNLSVQQVWRFRTQHGLTLRHCEEALLDPDYKEWYEAREKDRINMLREAFQKRHLRNLSKLLERAKVFFLRNPIRMLGTRNCASCGNTFPATAQFFRSHKRLSGGRKYRVLTYICHACPSRKKEV